MVLLSFILILSTCLITIKINLSIQENMRRRIEKVETAKESVQIRNHYRKIRIIIIIVYTLITILECILFIRSSSSMSQSFRYRQYINVVVLLPLIAYTTMSLPVSTLTIDSFKKKQKDKPFALFLRGFSTDDYCPPTLEAIEALDRAKNFEKTNQIDPNTLQFSERNFFWALKRFMPSYSVGMTKELDSPSGTKRIYLDDSTWKSDVSDLIKKAQYIFILINPSSNCLWEILECVNNAKEKTAFFIDNENYVEEIKHSLKHNAPDCLYEEIVRHSLAYEINDNSIIVNYKNDFKGFRFALQKFFNDKRNSCNDNICDKVEGKCNESIKIDDKRLGIENLNLVNNDEFEIANRRVSNSTLTEEQKSALSLQVFLVHFQKKDKIDWDSIPGLFDDDNKN